MDGDGIYSRIIYLRTFSCVLLEFVLLQVMRDPTRSSGGPPATETSQSAQLISIFDMAQTPHILWPISTFENGLDHIEFACSFGLPPRENCSLTWRGPDNICLATQHVQFVLFLKNQLFT